MVSRSEAIERMAKMSCFQETPCVPCVECRWVRLVDDPQGSEQ